MRAILALFCTGLLCGTAWAADTPDSTPSSPPPSLTPQAPPPLDQATGAALAALFTEVCYHAFPDDAALETSLTAKGAMAMTPEQVKAILHDDPGRGWIVDQDNHRYQITVEAPPFHACSVRVNTPAGVSTSAMAQALPGLLGPLGQHAGAPQQLNRQDNPQMQIRAVVLALSPAPAGADAETFMSFVTTYRDRNGSAVLAVENRFVRQIHSLPVH